MGSGRGELWELGQVALRGLRGPVVSGVRRKLAAWFDPRARLLRQRRRARRAVLGRGTTTGVFGAGTLTGVGVSMETAAGAPVEVATFGLGAVTVVAGVTTVRAVRRLRALNRAPLPEPVPDPPRLPPVGSDAREPMQRLAAAESGLHRALSRLNADSADVSADHARGTAAEAAAALRDVADRLVAVEETREHVPVEQCAELDADAHRLRAELDDGLDRYGRLVAAAGHAVAAGPPADRIATDAALREATDRLAGLASALREMQQEQPSSGEDPVHGSR